MAEENGLDKPDRQEDNSPVAVAGRQRGTHMGFARMLATIAFVIALPVALLTSNIRLLANAPLVYDYSFDRYDAEEATGLSRSDLDGTAAALREYFNNSEKTFYFSVTQDGLETSVFNARETRHMEDVKALFVKVNRAQEISVFYLLAYVIAFFVWAREGNVRQLAIQCLVGLGVGLAAVGGVAIVAALGFEAAFTRFHTIVFTNDLWRLNPRTDHLIQMFPDPFWRDMTIFLGLLSAGEALIIGGVSAVYLLGTRSERRHLAGSIDVKSSTTQPA